MKYLLKEITINSVRFYETLPALKKKKLNDEDNNELKIHGCFGPFSTNLASSNFWFYPNSKNLSSDSEVDGGARFWIKNKAKSFFMD